MLGPMGVSGDCEVGCQWDSRGATSMQTLEELDEASLLSVSEIRGLPERSFSRCWLFL